MKTLYIYMYIMHNYHININIYIYIYICWFIYCNLLSFTKNNSIIIIQALSILFILYIFYIFVEWKLIFIALYYIYALSLPYTYLDPIIPIEPPEER